MRSERAIAVLMLILTGAANTRKDIAIKLNCSPASVSRAINDINCSMADFFDYYFQVKFVNNKYQLIHETYSPNCSNCDIIYSLKNC